MGLLMWWPPLAHLTILLALGAVCALRLGQMPPLPDPAPPEAPAARAATAANPLFALPEVGAYDGVLAGMDDRPLMTAGRRPAEGPQVAAAPPPRGAAQPALPPDLNLRLLAVIGQGAAMRALVVTTETEEEIWVREGDDLAGWQVAAIGPRTLEVRLGDQARTFAMFE